ASAEQVLASLARARSRHMSRDRSTAAAWLRNRLQSFWSSRYLARSLLRLVNNDRTRIRCGVFESSACSKIGDAPIASASLPGAQSSHETFDKRNKKPWLRQAENVTSRPTSHQPTPTLSRKGRGSQKSLRPRTLLLVQRNCDTRGAVARGGAEKRGRRNGDEEEKRGRR